MPRYTALVSELPSTVPFVGPETQERARGRPFKARLGANEMGFGPSPRAIEAMAAEAAESWMYGEPENYELKQALAKHHGVSAANIVVVRCLAELKLERIQSSCCWSLHSLSPTGAALHDCRARGSMGFLATWCGCWLTGELQWLHQTAPTPRLTFT